MHKLVRQHVMPAWIAMLGILFSVLAPALSHAMPAAARSTQDIQVCTMAGMKTIVVDQEQPADTGASPGFKHCAYCLIHDGAALPPPPIGLAWAPLAVGALHPPLFYQSALPLFIWNTANPRAPPSHD